MEISREQKMCVADQAAFIAAPIDLHPQPKRPDFMITLTTGGEFSVDFTTGLKDWFVKKCTQVLLVTEGWDFNAEERPHYHGVGSFKTNNASNITRMLKKLYDKFEVPWQKNISIRVRKVTDLIGSWHYCLKDTSDGNPPLLVMGWRMSFIKEQCRANVGKIPYKVLMKNKHCLSTKTATATVMAYAKASAHVLSGKESFASVICQMAQDGYQFENVKIKWLYTQCMSLTGDSGPMRSLIMGELRFCD